MFDLPFFLNCILLGVALAVDAFSVSIANGLTETERSFSRTVLISGTFGAFQFLMPLLGWVLVKTFISFFSLPKFIIPLLAMLILGFLGVKTIIDSKKGEQKQAAVKFVEILIQGVATSLDALSVGLTISDYDILQAIVCATIIGVETFALCIVGVTLGKGVKKGFSSVAGIVGGIILIAIGIEIFIRGII